MSDTESKIKPEADGLGDGSPRPADLALARRRRFIKLGASTAAVTATLASRPVMAWDCHTTSAWGSAQLANQVGSAKTRLDKSVVSGAECWYIADWCNKSAPWRVLTDRCYGTSKSVSHGRTKYKLYTILPNGISEFSADSTTTVYAVLKSGNDFAIAVTVARLNSIFGAGAFNIRKCIVSGGVDQIPEMARLGDNYSPPSTGVKWTKNQIKTYLAGNWLAT